MTRLRSPAQRAPQTIEAATALLNRFALADAELASVEAQRQADVACINAAADAVAVPIVAELKDIVKQLKPWWAASVDELTGGKRKSIEIGGCIIGYRISPPKVMFAGGTDDDAVIAVTGTAWADAVIRTKLSIDKPAILKLLEGEDAVAVAELGFEARQREEFFVDRVPPKPVVSELLDEGDTTAVR